MDNLRGGAYFPHHAKIAGIVVSTRTTVHPSGDLFCRFPKGDNELDCLAFGFLVNVVVLLHRRLAAIR